MYQQNKGDPTINYQAMVDTTDEIHEDMNKMKIAYFINQAILNVQSCFNAQMIDIKSGMIKFVVNVQMLESICRAKNLLQTDYTQAIDAYKQEADYKTAEKDVLMGSTFTLAEYKLSMYKFEKIINRISQKETVVKSVRI